MQRACPECGGDLDDLEPEAEMGSRPVRYLCHACQLLFESDPAGGLLEVDEPRSSHHILTTRERESARLAVTHGQSKRWSDLRE